MLPMKAMSIATEHSFGVTIRLVLEFTICEKISEKNLNISL